MGETKNPRPMFGLRLWVDCRRWKAPWPDFTKRYETVMIVERDGVERVVQYISSSLGGFNVAFTRPAMTAGASHDDGSTTTDA